MRSGHAGVHVCVAVGLRRILNTCPDTKHLPVRFLATWRLSYDSATLEASMQQSLAAFLSLNMRSTKHSLGNGFLFAVAGSIASRCCL